ncbi:MAG: hypothetical protein V2A62_03380 [Candidatus Woesearchaeota archaeon]
MSKTIYTNGKIFGDIEFMAACGDWQREYRLEEIAAEVGYTLKEEVIRNVVPDRGFTQTYKVGPKEDDLPYAMLTLPLSLHAILISTLGLPPFCSDLALVGKEVQAFYKENQLCGFRALPKK